MPLPDVESLMSYKDMFVFSGSGAVDMDGVIEMDIGGPHDAETGNIRHRVIKHIKRDGGDDVDIEVLVDGDGNEKHELS